MAYSKISLADKQRLLNAFENEEDYVQLASQLNIKRTTARSIVVRALKRDGVVALPRGGRRENASKVDEEIAETVEEILNDNPGMTLVGISKELTERLPDKPIISRTTISRLCNGLLFRQKNFKSDISPLERNSKDVKLARMEFALWYEEHGLQAENVIFVDESEFNLWTQRTRKIFNANQKAVRVVDSKRGKNVSLIMAISPQFGLIEAKLHEGPTTTEIFQDFLNVLGQTIEEKTIYLIMDDSPWHTACKSPFEVKYLPACSPFLNPVEDAFLCWMDAVKNFLSLPKMQVRINDKNAALAAGLSILGWRRNVLKDIGQSALTTITLDLCASWYQFSVSYLKHCKNMADIQF